MKSLVVILLLFASTSHSQSSKDRKEIFELRTKCMELAKDFCNEERVEGEFERNSGGSFYDVKRNRCYAICTWRHTDTTSTGRGLGGFISVSLSDVHTGSLMALYTKYFVRQYLNYGEINGERTTMEKAEAYIKRMTTE